MNRVLHMDSDIPSVYFPIGDPGEGGTCYYATEKCKEYCPSGLVVNEHERWALNYFREHSASEVAEKILDDFGYLADRPYNAKMIQWFPWGDCLPDLTGKLAEVVLLLFDKGIPQYGFTRNRQLWETLPRQDRLNIGLTVDDIAKAKRISVESGKMTANPDFIAGYAQIVFDGEIKTRCNGWWCVTDDETRNSDCSVCLARGTGCYSTKSEERDED